MITYTQTIDNKTYWYFYDRSIRLWTVMLVDENDNQIGTADHYHDKGQMLYAYKFDFKTRQ